MLLNLHKKSWMDGLTLKDYTSHCTTNEKTVKEMLELAKNYNKALEEEETMTPEQLAIKNVGKQVSVTDSLFDSYHETLKSDLFNFGYQLLKSIFLDFPHS